jgi:hypothetical protein
MTRSSLDTIYEKLLKKILHKCFGGVLSQRDHVVCYESGKLKEHEGNYATYDLELAESVHALKMWRHYIMGNKFELRIDHYGLKHLFG